MKTKTLKPIGRIFYGAGIAGIGILHFFYQGFRQVISPLQPDDSYRPLIYLIALYFVVSGLLIAAGKKLPATSIILAYVLICFIVFSHLPWLFIVHPLEFLKLGSWTNTLKLSAFIGGALFLSQSSNSENVSNNFITKLTTLAPFAKYFFCIMLLTFGIDHFVYKEFVSGLVPKWIPFPVFWTYLTGIALLGAGLAILIDFKVKLVAQLLAVMLFFWLLTIHLVLAIRYPEWNNGENITACFQCLAFTGIALFIAGMKTRSEPTGDFITNRYGKKPTLKSDQIHHS